MQCFSGLLLVFCDIGHGDLEVHIFLRQGVQCLKRLLVEVTSLVVSLSIFPVSGVEAPFATVEQSMEFTQSPLYGLAASPVELRVASAAFLSVASVVAALP